MANLWTATFLPKARWRIGRMSRMSESKYKRAVTKTAFTGRMNHPKPQPPACFQVAPASPAAAVAAVIAETTAANARTSSSSSSSSSASPPASGLPAAFVLPHREMKVPRSMPPNKKRSRALPNKVIFCFNALATSVDPEYRSQRPPADQSLAMRLIYWGLGWFGDTFKHVECLFYTSGNPRLPTNWAALTVSAGNSSGLYEHMADHYSDGRWSFFVITGLQYAELKAMWDFAVHEHESPRSYSNMVLLEANPSTAWVAPVVRYTPGCGALCSSGSGPRDSVYCVELISEMLVRAFPKLYPDGKLTGLRPDGLLALLRQRHELTQVVLGAETGDAAALERQMRDALRKVNAHG
jgi:hypothetical protein